MKTLTATERLPDPQAFRILYGQHLKDIWRCKKSYPYIAGNGFKYLNMTREVFHRMQILLYIIEYSNCFGSTMPYEGKQKKKRGAILQGAAVSRAA
jgi:hypothetical protein